MVPTDRDSCPDKEPLVTFVYGESADDERDAIERHLSRCGACREEVALLGDLRATLQAWHPPGLPGHIRVVAEPRAGDPIATPGRVALGPPRWFARESWRMAALAAAATLVLGVAAGLAGLEVTVGRDGVTVRTGWGSATGATARPEGRLGTGSSLPDVAGPAAPRGTPAETAVKREDLHALEMRLREELEARLGELARAPGGAATARAGEDALLRRVQAMIDAAETRQQRNLALRITELARDLEVQRRTDLVQISHGLGQVEGRAQAEAARTRELMNYIVRVSGTVQPR